MSGVNPLVATGDGRWEESHPAWWRRLLSTYDRLAVGLVERYPDTAIRTLGRVGESAHRLGLAAPSPRLVREVFPFLERAGVHRVARQSAALRFRNRAAIAVLHTRGPGALAKLLAPGQEAIPGSLGAQASPGAVLLAFHVGAEFGITAALHQWGLDPVPLRNWSIEDVDQRARALRQTVEEVRTGRPVLAIVDGPGGASSAPIPVLGRRIVLRRAPFMLARVTRAPVVPAVAQWTPAGRIRVRIDDALAIDRAGTAEEVEARMASAAGAWLDRHLTEHPEDAWPYTIANFSGAPRAGPG